MDLIDKVIKSVDKKETEFRRHHGREYRELDRVWDTITALIEHMEAHYERRKPTK